MCRRSTFFVASLAPPSYCSGFSSVHSPCCSWENDAWWASSAAGRDSCGCRGGEARQAGIVMRSDGDGRSRAVGA